MTMNKKWIISYHVLEVMHGLENRPLQMRPEAIESTSSGVRVHQQKGGLRIDFEASEIFSALNERFTRDSDKRHGDI